MKNFHPTAATATGGLQIRQSAHQSGSCRHDDGDIHVVIDEQHEVTPEIIERHALGSVVERQQFNWIERLVRNLIGRLKSVASTL